MLLRPPTMENLLPWLGAWTIIGLVVFVGSGLVAAMQLGS